MLAITSKFTFFIESLKNDFQTLPIFFLPFHQYGELTS